MLKRVAAESATRLRKNPDRKQTSVRKPLTTTAALLLILRKPNSPTPERGALCLPSERECGLFEGEKNHQYTPKTEKTRSLS